MGRPKRGPFDMLPLYPKERSGGSMGSRLGQMQKFSRGVCKGASPPLCERWNDMWTIAPDRTYYCPLGSITCYLCLPGNRSVPVR